MMPLEHELVGLAKLVKSWIVAGAKLEEIQERLSGSDKVAADLLKGALERRTKGAAYLGRDAKGRMTGHLAKGLGDALMVEVEEAPERSGNRNG